MCHTLSFLNDSLNVSMTTEHRYAILVYENIAHVKRLVKRLYVGAFASVFNLVSSAAAVSAGFAGL